jgi:hypothetical protein
MISQKLVDWEVFVATMINELNSSRVFMVLVVWTGAVSERSVLHQWREEGEFVEEHFDFYVYACVSFSPMLVFFKLRMDG